MSGYAVIAFVFYEDERVATRRHSTPVVVDILPTQDSAFALHRRLTEASDKGRLVVFNLKREVQVSPFHKSHWVRPISVLSVRPADHELTLEAMPGSWAILAPGKGTTKRQPSCKRWGIMRGYVGNGGGWISNAHGTQIAQGWEHLVPSYTDNTPTAKVIEVEGRWHVVERSTGMVASA